jgi:hypothetical protein
MMRALFAPRISTQIQRGAFIPKKIGQHAVFAIKPLTAGKFGVPVQAIGIVNGQLKLINNGDLRTALRPIVMDATTGRQRQLQPGEFVKI